MSTAMPPLHTERLTIRPFVTEDLNAVHRVMSSAWDIPPEQRSSTLPARERWLRWTTLNYDSLAGLDQPPYGERAVTLKETGALVGVVGVVPALGPFGQLPDFPAHASSRYWSPEVGLFWATDPDYQGRGYATEAARAVIDFMFTSFNLGRIVATTEYDNQRSIAVMRNLGMQVLRNPLPTPPWFQVVGLLERSHQLRLGISTLLRYDSC